MSFNGWTILGCVAFFVWGTVHGCLLSRETEEERVKAIQKEKEAAERNRAMAKQAAMTGAKIAGKALLKMLKK